MIIDKNKIETVLRKSYHFSTTRKTVLSNASKQDFTRYVKRTQEEASQLLEAVNLFSLQDWLIDYLVKLPTEDLQAIVKSKTGIVKSLKNDDYICVAAISTPSEDVYDNLFRTLMVDLNMIGNALITVVLQAFFPNLPMYTYKDGKIISRIVDIKAKLVRLITNMARHILWVRNQNFSFDFNKPKDLRDVSSTFRTYLIHFHKTIPKYVDRNLTNDIIMAMARQAINNQLGETGEEFLRKEMSKIPTSELNDLITDASIIKQQLVNKKFICHSVTNKTDATIRQIVGAVNGRFGSIPRETFILTLQAWLVITSHYHYTTYKARLLIIELIVRIAKEIINDNKEQQV